jgi:TfoX/Sxy family transcriptional regulator of competence genes
MAYDEGHLEIMRDLLSARDGITEVKMFGGICFMSNGNMLCGVHKDGGMFRVGKENADAALALDGIHPLSFTGRKMGGLVDVTDEAFANEDTLKQLLSLSDSFVGKMPPK